MNSSSSGRPIASYFNRQYLLLFVLAVPMIMSGCGSRNSTAGFLVEEIIGEGELAGDQLLRRLDRSARYEPDEPYWLYQAAEVCTRLGRKTESEEYLRASLDRDPAYMPALTAYSKLLYESGRYGEALSIIDGVRRNGSIVPEEVLASFALHSEAAGEPGGAAEVIELLHRPGPHWKSTGSSLAYIRLKGENFENAGEATRSALLADPGSAANHNNYGISLLYAGDPMSARDSFLNAVEIDSDLPGPYYNLAIVEQFYFYDEQQAAEWFGRYSERASADPDGIAPYFDRPAGTLPVGGDGNGGIIGEEQ